MQVLPNLVAALVDNMGKMVPPWNSFFQQFVQSPSPGILVPVGASPFTYTAKEPGNIMFFGGTITGTIFNRGSVSIDITGQKIIPLGIEDSVRLSYSVVPTFYFIPLYGAVSQ